jgi:hypothetical protein
MGIGNTDVKGDEWPSRVDTNISAAAALTNVAAISPIALRQPSHLRQSTSPANARVVAAKYHAIKYAHVSSAAACSK